MGYNGANQQMQWEYILAKTHILNGNILEKTDRLNVEITY